MAPVPNGPPGTVAARLSVFGRELESHPACRLTLEPGQIVAIGGRRWTVTALHGPDNGHPWCGRDELTGLIARSRPADRVRLEFVTPTTFRFGDQVAAGPVERLLIGSWLRAWRAAGGDEIDAAVATELHTGLGLRTCDIRKLPAWPGGPEAFTGTVELSLPYGCSALEALTRFAFYCGTGWKTAMGMGLTRRLG